MNLKSTISKERDCVWPETVMRVHFPIFLCSLVQAETNQLLFPALMIVLWLALFQCLFFFYVHPPSFSLYPPYFYYTYQSTSLPASLIPG